MRFTNLTPHEIDLILDNGTVLVIEPAGTPCRLVEYRQHLGYLDGLPLYEKRFGGIIDLPAPAEDTTHIVSLPIAQRLTDRVDVVAVDQVQRDDGGRIVGAKALCRYVERTNWADNRTVKERVVGELRLAQLDAYRQALLYYASPSFDGGERARQVLGAFV
jgi:hypothetical protein